MTTTQNEAPVMVLGGGTENAPLPIRQEVSKEAITVDNIKAGQYQKPGTLSAQLRQRVSTKSFYPSKKIESSLQSNVFGLEDFGFSEQEFISNEIRMAWIPVPEKAKLEEVVAKLAAASKNGATIYRALSNRPILDENQVYAVGNPDVNATLDTFADAQVVRYPAEHEKAGQIILDNNGKVQYRRTFFWATPKADVDARTVDAADCYVSPNIAAELEGAAVMQGQTI